MTLQSRLHGGMALFIEVLAFHGLLGSSNGRFGGCFVDLLFEDGHISGYGDRFLCDLDKARPYRQPGFLATLHNPKLSRHDLRHQCDVLRKDAELSFSTRDHNGIHVV